MPTPEISQAGKPLSAADVARVEALLEARLPPQYVAFLLRNNGGMPEPDGFYDAGGKFEESVHFFYSVDGDANDDIVKHAQFFREYHDVAPNLLPIARTGGGDLVCIKVGEHDPGQIIYWSHDAPDRDDSTWKLADDLDSFLETFHE